MITLLIVLRNLMILIIIHLIIVSHRVSETFLVSTNIICLMLVQWFLFL